MAKKKQAFDAYDAKYIANWLKKCVAMDRGEMSYKCKYCPCAGDDCINNLMTKAASILEDAARKEGIVL